MKNFVHQGLSLTLTAPYAVLSGGGLLVGKIFAVACQDADISTSVEARAQGVFDLDKDASVFAQGADVYWDNSAKVVTSTPASNPVIGQAEVAAVTGDSTVRVRLTPSPQLLDAAAAGITSSAAELNMVDGSLAGTAVASKALVLDAQKAVDTIRATSDLNVGGTGVPGAANVETKTTKVVTGLTDTVATDVLTVTVPNAAHAAFIDIDVLGVLGAGGSIGAGESACLAKYQVSIVRTAGAAAVAALSSAIGGVKGNVAGGQAITSVVATLGNITGAVGATNTFTVKVAITRAGSGADNHVAHVSARVLNANATGVTIA